MARLLGIDYGTKRVGLALSDEEEKLAFPKDVLPNDSNLMSKLATFAADNAVAGIVVGHSTDAQGKPNPVEQDITAFCKKLERAIAVPMHREPEFYSTAQAARSAAYGDAVDASAAAIILQSYLDKKNEARN